MRKAFLTYLTICAILFTGWQISRAATDIGLPLMGTSYTPSGGGGTGCGAASFALDGNNNANKSTGTSLPVTLTTTGGCGIIVVGLVGFDVSAGVPTATGLTFTQRGSGINVGGQFTQVYTAPYSTNFSGTITATTSSSGFDTVLAFGISGPPSSSFFDTNASLPGQNTTAGATTTATISTSNANDFIYFIGLDENNSSTAITAPFTVLYHANLMVSGYQIVSSTQSSISATYTTPSFQGSQIDAIIK